jgi:hypothetical protein
MKIRHILSGLLLLVAVDRSAIAGIGQPEFNEQLSRMVSGLNREAAGDGLFSLLQLIQREFGTSQEELSWAAAESMNPGEVAVFAYIQATTGRRFSEISRENARVDFWTYAVGAGMNCDKMAESLDGFLKRAERERNSRIFAELRSSRRVHTPPDLGNGFGLFQEALDFRRIESPGPVKIHPDSGAARAKVVWGTPAVE